MKFQPGKLNKRIEIKKLDEVSDGGGGYKNELVLIKKVWSNIQPLYGRELYQARQTQADVSHKVTIRFTKEVNRSHIVSFNGKNYDIQYLINVNEANRFLELHVLERQ